MKVINLSTLEAFYYDGKEESVKGLLSFLEDKVDVKNIDQDFILWYRVPVEYDNGVVEESNVFGYDVEEEGYFVWDGRNQNLHRYEKKEFFDNFIEVNL